MSVPPPSSFTPSLLTWSTASEMVFPSKLPHTPTAESVHVTPSSSKPVQFRNPNGCSSPRRCYVPGRCWILHLHFVHSPLQWTQMSTEGSAVEALGQYRSSNLGLCPCNGIMVLLDEQVRWGIKLLPALGSTYHFTPSSPSIL